MGTIRTFVKGKTAANDFMLNICTLQFIVCKSLLAIILMHIGFKEYKLHLSWAPIIYFCLGLFHFFWAFYLFEDSEEMKEKMFLKKKVLVSSAKLMRKDNVFTKKD